MEFLCTVKVEKISKKFGEIVGVSDQSFEVAQDEIFGFLKSRKQVRQWQRRNISRPCGK